MATSVHSDSGEEQVEGSEPGEDGYWPALEILNERKYDYLVNWDGIDPETGRAWTPSWTRKTEVTEDLIEVWEAKKAAKKKKNRRAPNKLKKARMTATTTPTKPVDRNSRSSRTSPMSGSRTTDSPVISLSSDNNSRVSGEPSLGKRKRQYTRHTPADGDPKPVPKKQKVAGTSSSASQKSRTKSIRSLEQISRKTIHEEEEGEDTVEAESPDKVSRPPSTSKAGIGNTVVRIGPPRRRKKLPSFSSAATLPTPKAPSPVSKHLREEEEENTQEATGIVPQLGSSPPAVKKRKRRLKPASDVRPKVPALAVKGPSVPPSRDATQEPQEPSDQEGPVEVDLPPPDQDDEPTEPLPEPTPPRAVRQPTSPNSPVNDAISTPTPPRARKSTKRLGPIPGLQSSHFKPYLLAADTTSVIDEFSPKKSFPTQDAIESPVRYSQTHRTATKHLHQNPEPRPADDPLVIDITQEMQDVQDAYLDFDGRANESEVLYQERPTTDPGSAEQDPLLSQSPSETPNARVQTQSFNSQKLEDALIILNQKSEEIEVLESRLAAQEAQIEHLQAENYRIQIEGERLSVSQEVQREALEEAKGTVSELGVHIDWLQDSLDKSEAKVKQLQAKTNDIQDTLDARVKAHNLAQVGWEEERAVLETRLASLEDGPPQQLLADWEAEKKELKDKLAEVTEERDQLDKGKRYAENEIESWKEQYRKEFIHSQELRREAKDAKTETSRIQEEKTIATAQTKEAVRLVMAKYEAIVERLKIDLAKAESLYKVLQAKDEQTGDDVRRRAISAIHLQDEVRRLREELALEVTKKTARAAELRRGEYACQYLVDGVRCDQGFDSPQELWSHVIGGHVPSRGQK